MKLLLHACCGPCAIYPIEAALDAGHEITLFYVNPNIQPQLEWARRLENLQTVALKKNLPLLIDPLYLEAAWLQRANDPERCHFCYQSRLSLVREKAEQEGFEAFSTTLLVSPYQNREAIVRVGKTLEREGLVFLADDWRDGYRDGQQKARDMGLYRQKYCGCIPSIDESAFAAKIKKQHELAALQALTAAPAPDNTSHK